MNLNLFSAGLCLVSASFFAELARATDPKRDPEVAQKISVSARQRRKILVNIRLKCEWTWDEAPDVRSGYDWIWTASGKFRLFEWSKKRGKSSHEELYILNEHQSMHLINPHGDPPTKADRVEIRPKLPVQIPWVKSTHSLWFPVPNHWLNKQLENRMFELERPISFQGLQLPRVKVTRNNGALWVTLDPEKDYSARLIDTADVLNPSTRNQNRIQTEIIEFQQLKPSGIWFPQKGKTVTWHQEKIISVKRWNVTEIEINKKLSDSLFRFEIPDGTPVKDRILGIEYIQGDKKSSARNAATSPDSNSAKGSEPTLWQRWGIPLFIGLTICLAFLTIWSRFRV